MKKKFTILIAAALMLLTMMARPVTAWGQTRTEVTDVMNQEWTGVNGTSYSQVTGLEGSASDAVYTVQCAGGNSSIQLRSNNNNSGIVSTTSGGTVKKVTVTWNSSTSSGRTLNVYGKNAAYSAPSDLYGSDAGTLIGTIVCGTSTELTITDSYTHIGMRSASGAMYLTEIDVTWETGGGSGGSDPTITLSDTGTGNIGNYAVNTEITREFTVTQSNLTAPISLSATNGGTFTINNEPTNSIPAGDGSTVVTWHFTPTATGQFTSEITASSGETSATCTYLGYAYANHNVIIDEMEHGTVTADPTSTYYYQNVTLTVTPDDGYELGTLSVLDGNNAPVTVTNNSFKMPDSDATVSATFVESSGSTVTDELTNSNTIGETTNNYSEWTATGISGAEYAGQSAGGNGTIQLRSNNSNSGIVSTTSGGKVKKVTVTWNSNTADARTLNIYGSNTAYTAASDLYGNNAGTLLGTLNKGNEETNLNITDDYAYIGIRSASGALYLDKIEIDWETSGTPTCAAPTFTPVAGTYYETQSITIASATEGATIYYTLDGNDPTTSSSVYNSALSISETTTVKAMAVKEGYNNSSVSTAAYTITLPPVATPTFTPASGTYTETQNVTIACTTEGATIYYTIDGTDPTTESSVYSSAISISQTTTVKAMAVKTGMSNSEIATAVYTIEQALNTMQAIFDRATEVGNTATDVNIALQNWVVSGVSTNEKNVFITDGTKGFVIYDKNAGMGFAVGDVLSGTVSCQVQLYNGFAEITQLNASTTGISIATGGTVTAANIAMAELAGVNTGALVHYDNLTCSVNNNKYYLSDGTTTLQVFNTLFAFDPLESGKIYNITGVYQQYNTNSGDTKEILPRSADDIEEVVSTTPSVTIADATVNVNAEGGNGTVNVTYTNIDPNDIEPEAQFFASDGETSATYNWITVTFNTENNAVYTVEANDGEARTAYFKVYEGSEGIYSNLVTVSQEEYVAPSYAALPFSFNGGKADIENTDGLTQEGLGSDYNATSNPTTKLKFDGTGDWLLLQFQERPGTLTFNIKGNSFSGSTFKVQTSEDGITYTDLETYTELGDTQDESFDNLGENVRYIKWIYTEKSSGNVGLGNIALAAYAEPAASITVANGNANIDVNATGVDNATLAIAYENLTITEQGDFDIQYYNENGDELGKDDQPDWMEASIQVNTTQDGYEVSYSVDPNDGAARTAYFKVYALDNNSELVYSNLVTINQAAYVAPVATITVADGNANIDVDVNGVENATLAIAYENLTITENTDFDIQYYNENGDELGKDDQPDWMEASIQVNTTQDGYEVSYSVDPNDGAARTAYFKVFAMGDQDFVYSNLVTINQAAYVVDYATLPFEWEGGPRSDFEALNGTSTSGVGDYNNEATHKMKLDGTGDYIQIKTNEQPGIVTIGVKMVGGATTSTITVQGSADGETFTNVDTLTISGKQNDVLNLETTYDFAATDRYVRLYFTKGSNVGVGPITIAKHVVKYAVNLNQPLNNEGSISADKETAAEGETVTLTATPNTGYAFGSWTVLDGDAQEVTITNNAFVMPASDVEVEASFTALDKHIIVIPVAIENNVIVDVTNNQAYANETVTITVDAPDNKVLATLTVTGNTSSNNITIAPEVSPYVDEYTFTMPDEDVTINATFDDAPSFTVSFSVNGSVDASLEVSVSQGQSTALPTSSTLTPEGFSIIGWAATNGSTEAVADPYTPNADITLYAILGQTIPHSLVITASTPNFPTSYGTANTFTEYNLGGKNFKIQQGFINGGKLQWRAAGNNNGTGTMYNSEDLGKINTIILVYDESDTKKNFTIKAGTTENPTEGTSIEPSTNGLVYTFDLSQGNYKYFVMTNGENAGYLQSIAIDYVADLNVNTIAHIATSTTYTTDIPATTCVIVDSGAVLTLNGTNNGTPDNLIIEDGGQLIHNDPVSATMRMTVSGYGRGGSGYKFIASPVSGSINVGSTNLTDGSYDLYIFDQSKAGEEWRNYKASAFTTIDNGKGYLYAHNPTTTIEFAGELQPSNVNVDVNLDYTAEKPFSGVNLVGNPFACNAYVNTAYYVMNTTGDNYVAKTTADAIPPCTGILVGATAASQKVTFSKNAPSANPGQGNLNIQVAQVVNTRGAQPTSDNAIIRFDGGNTLEKFSFRDDRAKLYIPQGKRDYAVVNAETQGETPLYFKAVENGTYTIDFSKENVEFSYLHLIDNLTGVDIDLLQNPSYSFEANNKDYPSRFRLLFKANGINANANENENFGFISNGNLMILGIDGEATLQVIDVTGRILSSETFSGSYNKAVNGVAGMYMIRLIQGENVRTQKIVVK